MRVTEDEIVNIINHKNLKKNGKKTKEDPDTGSEQRDRR